MAERPERLVLAGIVGEEPDLGPAPVVGRRAERVWRFEWPGSSPGPTGICMDCDGVHINDRETLDALLRSVQNGAVDDAPCVCRCCAIISL